jgi:hypothetical protein
MGNKIKTLSAHQKRTSKLQIDKGKKTNTKYETNPEKSPKPDENNVQLSMQRPSRQDTKFSPLAKTYVLSNGYGISNRNKIRKESSNK